MRSTGPIVDPLPCSGCGTLIDPLRAGHVAVFDLRFHYFCNRTHCRSLFLGADTSGMDAPRSEPRAATRTSERHPLEAPIITAHMAQPDPVLPETPPRDDDPALIEPVAQTTLSAEPGNLELPEPRDIGVLLLVMATIAGALAVTLALAGNNRLVIGARIVLSAVGLGMLFGRAGTTPREPSDPHPAPALAGLGAALVTAVWAGLGRDRPLAAEAASLAGILVTAASVGTWLTETAGRRTAAERAWIASLLAVPSRRVSATEGSKTEGHQKVFDVRSGEVVVVEPGEVVPVDLVVSGSEVEVLPWVFATTSVRRRDGDAVVAGARVVRGRLRGVCTWADHDRAFARVLLDPRRRADVLAPLCQASRGLAEHWAIAVAVVSAVIAAVTRRAPIDVAMTAVAVHAALSTPLIACIAGTHVARGVLLGLRRGIVYKSADAWDRGSRVNVAMFCARGTLLLGEPEVAEIESTSNAYDPGDVLALAAGAERTQEHPIAYAILRAARSRGVRPEGVRNASFHPGLGVTAVTAAGEELCVGSRALLLEQRVSVAVAEQRVAALESLGRTVVLVAVGSRLVGLCALQDGLRPGARAAVQHLLDGQIEPVLLAGDARETCEAIARSLDIDHVRPEVLPGDRAAEVRRLTEAGMSVAVLGHPGIDDEALGAADVAVALRAAGTAPADFAVCLASDDVRDGCLSLALARRTRLEARLGLALTVGPALVGAIVVALGILPPAYAPLAALLGGAVAVVHVKRCP